MAEKKAILTIDDIAPDREIVSVFGKDYPLLDYEDMGLVRYSKFLKKYRAVGEQAEKADELDAPAYGEFERGLCEMVETVLMGIPHDVAEKISIEKKQKVLTCFFTVATRTLQATMKDPEKTEGQQTTAT